MGKLPNFKNFSIFNKHVNQALTYIFHQAKQPKLKELALAYKGGKFFDQFSAFLLKIVILGK